MDVLARTRKTSVSSVSSQAIGRSIVGGRVRVRYQARRSIECVMSIFFCFCDCFHLWNGVDVELSASDGLPYRQY